ncbi:MAG TPA: hypothetical protein VM165_14125, partial [Planctomycetaceae bacterium]|nr:hypothetical protein [Planctomycetaceae bacterium]
MMPDSLVSRRDLMKSVAAAGAVSLVSAIGSAQPVRPGSGWRTAVLDDLARHARKDGGYGWTDQPRSHLTPTFAVIGCYRLLGRTPPNPQALAEFVRTHHPMALKKLEQEHHEFEFQQIQSLVWLDAEASFLSNRVRSWTRPTVYLKQYEQHGHPILRYEVAAFTCRELLGLPLDDLSPEFIAYLNSRRRADGSFNNTPAADGSGGHVLNTWWGLSALRTLNRHEEHRDATVAWLQACQQPN